MSQPVRLFFSPRTKLVALAVVIGITVTALIPYSRTAPRESITPFDSGDAVSTKSSPTERDGPPGFEERARTIVDLEEAKSEPPSPQPIGPIDPGSSEWRAALVESYKDYSLQEVVDTRDLMRELRAELLWEQFDSRLSDGEFLEVERGDALEKYMVPQSDTAGEAIRQVMKTRFNEDGSLTDQWVFIQPSELSDEFRRVEREFAYLVIRAAKLGAALPKQTVVNQNQP